MSQLATPSIPASGPRVSRDVHAPSGSQLAAGPPSGFAGGTRLTVLDGVRGLAILLVLIWHFQPQTSPGTAMAYLFVPARLTWTGVDLFFVLSGFLIAGILVEARSSREFFKTFYVRRFFRIVPLYVAVYLAFLAASRVDLNDVWRWMVDRPAPWYAHLTFTQNLWMGVRRDFGAPWMMPTWSLAIEEQFYLLLPLLVRRFEPKRLAVVLIAGFIAAPVLRTAIWYSAVDPGIPAHVLMPCRADALFLGGLLALAVRNERLWKALSRQQRPLWAAFAILATGMLVITQGHWTIHSVPMITVGYTLIALFYGCLLLLVLTSRVALVRNVFSSRALVGLGVIAYGLYLFHQPVYWMCEALVPTASTEATRLVDYGVRALALLLIFTVAKASWHWFERPLLRLGHRYRY